MQRTFITIFLILAFILLATAVFAQDEPVGGPGQGNGVCQFIDEDGDGFNDLAPDHDGDGIPNGLDPDYVRPEDGTGNQYKHQQGSLTQQQLGMLMHLFDPAMARFAGETTANGHMFGLRDGTGTGFGPADGTGFGPGSGDAPGGANGPDGTMGNGIGNSGGNSSGNGNGQGGRR